MARDEQPQAKIAASAKRNSTLHWLINRQLKEVAGRVWLDAARGVRVRLKARGVCNMPLDPNHLVKWYSG